MTEPTHSFDPLSEATFSILLALSAGRRHGYAIMKDVHSLSRGRISLSTGTLYGALSRLLDQGLIARADEGDDPDGGRQRKSYRLTRQGRRALQAETERLHGLVRTAREYLGKAGD